MFNPNIFEIEEMIDYLEEFFNDDIRLRLAVGGMAGTKIFKYVMDAAMTRYPLERILIVEGCQDYIGIRKDKLINHVYYAELFTDTFIDGICPVNPFKPRFMNPKPEYGKQINARMLNLYDCIVVKDAHLIPIGYLNAFDNFFNGHICLIVDPFDIGGEEFMKTPTVVDSLNKLSAILAMARSTYNVDTRAIDKSVKCSVTESKISKRSIGKIDDKQYVTNDPELAAVIRHKQLQSPFRKNQKLFVTSDRINMNIASETMLRTPLTLNSMCVVVNAYTRPLMKLRVYASKTIYSGDVSYMDDPPDHMISVKPANILMINESQYHRYNHTVITGNIPLTKRQKYSLLKNSNNLTIAHS